MLVGLCHPGTWAEDHDLLFWGKGTNAPDGAGCPVTWKTTASSIPGILVLMHLMVLGAP